MGDITDQIGAAVTGIALTIGMVFLLLWGGLLFVLAWVIIQAGIEWLDHQTMLREAQAIFDRVRAADLPHLQIDPLLHSVFGEDIDLPETGEPDSGDWLFNAVFGKE